MGEPTEFISAPQFPSMASVLALLSAAALCCLQCAAFLATSLDFNYVCGHKKLNKLK